MFVPARSILPLLVVEEHVVERGMAIWFLVRDQMRICVDGRNFQERIDSRRRWEMLDVVGTIDF